MCPSRRYSNPAERQHKHVAMVRTSVARRREAASPEIDQNGSSKKKKKKKKKMRCRDLVAPNIIFNLGESLAPKYRRLIQDGVSGGCRVALARS